MVSSQTCSLSLWCIPKSPLSCATHSKYLYNFLRCVFTFYIFLTDVKKSHDTVSRFCEIFGYALAEHVEEINYHGSDHVVDGFMSLECAHSRAYQYIFVNSHLIVAGDLHSVVSTTFAESSFGVMANEPASMESSGCHIKYNIKLTLSRCLQETCSTLSCLLTSHSHPF